MLVLCGVDGSSCMCWCVLKETEPTGVYTYRHTLSLQDALPIWLDDAGLQRVLFNLAPGDWEDGERGIATQPGREAEFREALAIGLGYAVHLGRSEEPTSELPSRMRCWYAVFCWIN